MTSLAILHACPQPTPTHNAFALLTFWAKNNVTHLLRFMSLYIEILLYLGLPHATVSLEEQVSLSRP